MKPHRPPRGLTLVELMIGVALLAVLSTLAASPMGAWLARHRVKAAAAHLVADLADARHEAARLGQPLRVNFQGGNQWCYVITQDAAQDCGSSHPAVLKQVQAADHPGVSIVAHQPIDLDARTGAGLQAPAQVRLASTRGDEVLVKLSRLGRAALCAPQGGFPDLPRC